MNFITKISDIFTQKKASGVSFVPKNVLNVGGFGNVNPVFLRQSNYSLLDTFYVLGDLFSIIDTIADLSSNIELITVNSTGKEIKDPVTELLKKPNKNQNFKDFAYCNYIFYLVLGNSYINKITPEILKGDGELYTLFAQDVEIITKNDISYDFRKNEIVKYNVLNNSNSSFLPEEIIHFRTPNVNYNNKGAALNYLYGYSKLSAAIMASTSLQEVYNVIVSMYQKRGAIGILSSKQGDYPIQNPADIQEAYFKNYGLHANKSSLLITNASVEYQQMVMDFNKLLTAENKKSNIESLCNVFNYPLPLVFNDASTYNNLLTARQNLYTIAIIPLVNAFCDTLTRGFNLSKKGLKLVPKLDLIKELQESVEQKSKVYMTGFEKGIVTRNEARQSIDLPPVADGEKFIFDYTQTINTATNV